MSVRSVLVGVGLAASLLVAGAHLRQLRISAEFQAAEAADPALVRVDGVLQRAGEPWSGEVIERWEDGSIERVTTYRDGVRHGLTREWTRDASKMSERAYRDGCEHGLHRGWWPDGTLRFEYTYVEGLMEGPAREWYADGSIYREATYRAGQEEGTQRMYDPDGGLRANYVVKDGRRYGLPGAKGCMGDKSPAQDAGRPSDDRPNGPEEAR